MAEMLADPGFELGLGWTYDTGAGGGWFRLSSAALARSGTYVADGISSATGATDEYHYLTSENVSVSNGTRYGFLGYREHGLSTSGDIPNPLRMQIDPGDGTFRDRKEFDQGTNRLYLSSGIGSFDATGTTARVRWRIPKGTGTGVSRLWLIDDCTLRPIEELVAIKLAERGVDALVTQLQTDLGTELGLIDTDRNDGVTMAVPASADYYKYEKPEISGATAHVEVFEGDFEFLNPYSDSDAERAVYELPITIRVTCFSRDGDDADTMHKRKRRYGAGIFNVLNKNPRLADTDNAIQVAVSSAIESEEDRDAEDNIRKVRTTVRALIRCEETQA